MLIVGYESPPFEGGGDFTRLQLLEKQLNFVGIVPLKFEEHCLRRPWKEGLPPTGFCRDSPKKCNGLQRHVSMVPG